MINPASELFIILKSSMCPEAMATFGVQESSETTHTVSFHGLTKATVIDASWFHLLPDVVQCVGGLKLRLTTTHLACAFYRGAGISGWQITVFRFFFFRSAWHAVNVSREDIFHAVCASQDSRGHMEWHEWQEDDSKRSSHCHNVHYVHTFPLAHVT